MRYSLFAFSLLTVLAMSSAAEASFYANARMGISKFDEFKSKKVLVNGAPATITDKDKDNYSSFYAGAIGYRWDLPFLATLRTEAEYTYRMPYEQTYVVNGTNYVKDKYKIQTLMLNVGADITVLPLVKPYAMAGIGVTHIGVDRKVFGAANINKPDSENEFTWTAGVGLMTSFLGVLQGDIGYRVTQIGTGGDATRAQEIILGARLAF